MQKYIINTIYIIPVFVLSFILGDTISQSIIYREVEVKQNTIQPQTEIIEEKILIQDLDETILKDTNDTLSATSVKSTENLPKVKYTCPKPKKEYPDMSLSNVGQDIPLLDTTYTPKNLELLTLKFAVREGICLEKNTKDAFEKMATDAGKEKIFIKVTSGFRSYNTQKSILEALKKIKTDAGKFVAKPGYSEHQIGNAIDISGASISYGSASGGFDSTIESNWLKQNAHIYGFILSYPQGKEEITGYHYEPWHYRYLGPEIANEIFSNNLTITEYLQNY